MANFSDIERRVGEYYSQRLADHGATPRGVDWNSHESQHLRFDQLIRAAPPEGSFSLNDYGCGYGALLDHLDAGGRSVEYHGFDVSETMIAAARERHGDRATATFSTDPQALQTADVTVASGIFNVLAGSDPEAWREYVFATARRMALLSRRAMAFNMLTSYSDPERMTPRLHYGDPCEIFDWCKRNLSRHVAVLHDYKLWEFTVIVRFDDERWQP